MNDNLVLLLLYPKHLHLLHLQLVFGLCVILLQLLYYFNQILIGLLELPLGAFLLIEAVVELVDLLDEFEFGLTSFEVELLGLLIVGGESGFVGRELLSEELLCLGQLLCLM